MKRSTSLGSRAFDACNVIFMAVVIVVMLYPMWYVLSASLSDPSRFISYSGLLLYPQGFSLDTYKMAFQYPLFLRSYLNTILYVLTGTALNLVMTTIAAYVLSRRDLYIKRALVLMITITMFFGGGLIPNFLVVKALGLYNTIFAILLPGAMSAWNTFVMRAFMLGLPASLEESARIDGARELRILWNIVLPLSLPVLAVMTLYYGVGHWNSWFSAAIYFKDRSRYPLQLIIRELLMLETVDDLLKEDSTSFTNWRAVKECIKYAVIIVATGPILCVYPFLQKYFAKGVMVGAIKG